MADPKQYESNWMDPFFRLRYGVGVNEKYDIADRGLVPGSTPVATETDPAKVDLADRYTSAYLFGKQHPYIGEFGTKVANALRFAEDNAGPLHEQALAGVRAGANAAFDEDMNRNQQAAAKPPSPANHLRVMSPSIRSNGY